MSENQMIDLKNNAFYLIGDVDQDMYKIATKGLTRIVNHGGADHVTIVLNTYGGDFYQGLAIYDMIKSCGVKTTIICSGPVMSAGTIILQAGTVRSALPHSQIMVHYGEDSNQSSEDIKHNQSMLKLMKTIISERTNVGSRKVSSWFKTDTYFDSHQALKFGLIDEVIGNE